MSDAGSTIVFFAIIAAGVYWAVKGYMGSDARLEAQVFGKQGPGDSAPSTPRPHARSKQQGQQVNVVFVCDSCGEDWDEMGTRYVQRCASCKSGGRNHRERDE